VKRKIKLEISETFETHLVFFDAPDAFQIIKILFSCSLQTVSSLNNSHSGSVELNESKTVSVDFEKTNSISSDEGSYNMHAKQHHSACATSTRKLRQTSSNSLTVQSFNNHLNQSMPNLSSGPYHTSSNNTLLVPGAKSHSSHSGNLLSPSQRGISYPPPSPTR
jgi:pleckstrin homology domain-containing family G member 5